MIASASASICARKCAELFTCCLQSLRKRLRRERLDAVRRAFDGGKRFLGDGASLDLGAAGCDSSTLEPTNALRAAFSAPGRSL